MFVAYFQSHYVIITLVSGQEAALNDLELSRVHSLLAQETHPAAELALVPQNIVILVVHADLFIVVSDVIE